jgi:hypothetical protein
MVHYPRASGRIRYVELNPVKAKLVAPAEDWPWSSARAHVAGKPEYISMNKLTKPDAGQVETEGQKV